MLRVANAVGFLGDWIDAPRRLVERAEVDYLTLEYLAELTLSILARAREKDPTKGYAEDFLVVLKTLCDPLRDQSQLKIATNGGGMNPVAGAKAAAHVLNTSGLGQTRIGVVTGDDLLSQIATLQSQGCTFDHFETGEQLVDLDRIVSANAYLGAQPIAEALAGMARIVITGRVADASLTVGPAMHAFGCEWNDWNRLAGYSVAGHLIECGAQVTGGYSVDWQKYDLADVGYPIAEIDSDGSCVITKPSGSGGAVTRQNVVQQLVYEIGDPRHYLTPDVDCDFATVQVDDQGLDRVRVSAATGKPAPETLKVSLAYRDGYMAAGQLLVHGRDCVAKAREVGRLVLARLKIAGYEPARHLVEILGESESTGEVVVRIAVHDPSRELVERFTREIAPLITSGPAGLAGYAAGRPSVRPVYAYWPTLIPRERLSPKVEVRTAQEWLS